MAHKLGISGSTILTNPNKFIELFHPRINHIEIGEFPNEKAFQQFIKLKEKYDVSFALHSPLFRNQSKYDLLEKVQFEPETAWCQFESEVARMANLNADYILVHFPYFKSASSSNSNSIIENGLKKLSILQKRYSIPIVCEPKLGVQRSPAGIQYLHQFPIELWAEYGIYLCIDIGDYLIAMEDKAITYIQKWKEQIKVVHLHNIEFQGDKYIWVPVHPSYEEDLKHYRLKEIIEYLSTCSHVYFVLEHTPHTNPTKEFVCEGIDWIDQLINLKWEGN
ncbi:hypothetical protein J6TS2_06360 [Heyndrickxia sporothermodurans]|nr:hypothetical protein J6TS2_06360 [Heyndrickxia sporothermodurans]